MTIQYAARACVYVCIHKRVVCIVILCSFFTNHDPMSLDSKPTVPNLDSHGRASIVYIACIRKLLDDTDSRNTPLLHASSVAIIS